MKVRELDWAVYGAFRCQGRCFTGRDGIIGGRRAGLLPHRLSLGAVAGLVRIQRLPSNRGAIRGVEKTAGFVPQRKPAFL